jgi:nitrogen regulatory protein PII-like uncharacterized protein
MIEELEILKEEKLTMEKQSEQIEQENTKPPNIKERKIENLKSDIDLTEKQIEDLDKKLEVNKGEMNELMSVISSLYQIFETNEQGPFKEFKLELDPENVQDCLAQIEKKTNLIMKLVKEAGLQEILIENSPKKNNLTVDQPPKTNKKKLKGFEDFLSKWTNL